MPEVSFVVANGQMPASELDDIMNNFYDGKFDVLLATTIVESGLDIPNANTLIVHHADSFGLAQLYQIRGRIGRSKQRAYALFTVPPERKLTDTAERRLNAVPQFRTPIDGMGIHFLHARSPHPDALPIAAVPEEPSATSVSSPVATERRAPERLKSIRAPARKSAPATIIPGERTNGFSVDEF